MIDTTSISELKGVTSIETKDPSIAQAGEDITIEDLIRNWGESDSTADLNSDGIVDVDDLLLLLERQSVSNPVINSIVEAPGEAIRGLASLGGLLMEALGIQDQSDLRTDGMPSVAETDSLDLTGMQPADVDKVMRTAKGMIDRWQSRGFNSAPPPGYEDVIDTLPMDRHLRGVLCKLIQTAYAK